MRIRLLLSFCLIASLAGSLRAQSLAGKKFCIDPGHGGHSDATDRHVIPDPGVDFYESESNFQTALRVKSLLEAQGATVILTRYTNDYPTDNEPSLAARYTTANTNNVDWFHSIHSNATGGTNTSTNYTMVLLKEQIASGGDPVYGPGTGQPQFPATIPMSSDIYQKIRQVWRTSSSSGNTGQAGVYLDFTFYGTYNLGVLRGLAMPGELSEAAFHDYYPQTRRMMNNDYLKLEAYALRDAIMQYFGVPADPKAIIAGLQTDQGTNAPLNGTVVRLMPLNRSYAGDQYNNGFFLFDSLDAGTYTVRFETSGYRPDSLSLSVGAGGISFADRKLRPYGIGDTIPPILISFDPGDGEKNVLPNHPLNLTFDKVMDYAGLNTNVTLREEGAVIAKAGGPLSSQIGANWWPQILPTPVLFHRGKSYTIEVPLLYDISGNALANPRIVTFQTSPDSLALQSIDRFDSDLSSWIQPGASGRSAGNIADSVSAVISNAIRVPNYVASGNLAAMRVNYCWDTTEVDWLLDLPLTSGPARILNWTAENNTLQVLLFGDASGTKVRFIAEDSAAGGPVTEAVSLWKTVDWYGWRMVDWDFAHDSLASGTVAHQLRFSRIQLTRNPLRALRSGFLTFDQLQLATLVKTTSITEAEALPSTMQLFPAYPNPFNPTTAMRYTVPVVALSPELVEGSKGGQRTVASGQRPMVSLKVYDMLGREVATLVHAPQSPGTYTVTWNAAGQASGVYLVRMAAGRYAGTQKIVLLK